MIVWLASYPRSGNTLFRIVAHNVFGLDTYSVYNDLDLSSAGMDDVTGQLGFDRTRVDEYEASDAAMFVKTHGSIYSYENMEFAKNCSAVYIVRDGRDTIVSYANYQLQIGKFYGAGTLGYDNIHQAIDTIIDGRYTYGKWCDHVFTWLKRRPVVIKFEDMLTRPVETVGAALKALSIPFTRGNSRIPTFDELHQRFPQFFRSGRIGGWRNAMTDAQHGRFWSIHGAAMEALKY